MENIIIRNISVDKTRLDISFDISEGLKIFFKECHFFCDYSIDISNVPKSILVVPLLTNLLPFSWITNSVIWVDEIDEVFYDNILIIKSAFREMHSNMKLGGTLIASRKVNNTYNSYNEGCIQLFTGGIDATATLVRIKGEKPVLFNTNGWYIKSPTENNPIYDSDYEAITEIAKTEGLSAEFVKSNFATFINTTELNKKYLRKYHTTWWFGFQHSMAFIGCSFVLGFARHLSRIYIASSYTFGQYIVCVSDPRIDSSIKCSNMKVVHDGYELSRQDKVYLITQHQKRVHRDVKLRVCSFNTHNCCECEKCFRTMLALISEGVDDLSQYGFRLNEPFITILKRFIKTKAMELDNDHIVFWYDIIAKMRDNYENICHKEVYDYLSNIDLKKERKSSILNHYRYDFFSILKRKLHLN